MPEVGVLNLTIQDNSTEAAGGLSELTGALVGLQNALGQGLKLSGVSKPLNTFANAVKENSKTFANVGTFLNAMSTYKKAFDEADKVRFNAQPIRDLKDAIGDGIRLGQAGTQIKNIREALTGEWNTDNAYKAGQALAAIGEGAKSMPSGLEKKADGISKVAAALQEYADASERIKSVVGSGPASALNDSMGKMSVGGRSFGLQFFGGTGGGDNAINEMKAYSETIHSAADEVRDFNVELRETKDVVESIRVNPFEDMYQSFSRMAHEFDWFKKESMRLMSGDSPLLLGDGRTPGQLLLGDGSEPQTFLKVWQDTGEQWKQNWVEFSSDAANEMRSQWKPDWIVGEGTVSATKEVVNEIKEGAQATQAMATAARDYNSEIGKVHNYFKGMSLEDIYNGTRENAMGKRSLMSEWLHGEGTETEQAYAIKQVAIQLGMSVDEVKRQVDIWNGVTSNMNTIDLSQYMDMSQTDLLTMKMNGMQDALMRDIEAGKLDQQQIAERAMAIQNLRDKIQELTDAQNEASGSTFSLGDAWKGLKAGIKGMFPTLTSMIKRLGTIAKYRFIRSVIKHITSGFSEGIQNVYEYSKAIGGSFAPAMDSAATAIAQMKNSLGAALAPAIQALIPILNTVVNWFITLVNYVNQFFALLSGQATWTRALPATVNAFDKQKKAAKGAGNAIKDLLADWDELNIIQSESGGGGAGSSTAAEDYLKMFEEVGKFDNEIKDTVKFIQDNMNDVIDIIKDAGIALLGWKFSKAFTGPLAAVGALIAAGKIMEITWKLTGLFDNEFIKTGNDGWIVADAMTNMFGAFLAGTAIETVIGGGTGIVTAGVTLVVSGGISYGIALANAQSDKADVLRDLAFIKTGIGLAAMSVGFGLATGSAVAGISLAAAFGVPMFVLSAAVTTVVQQIKTAKQIAKDAFTGKHYGAISVQELYDELNDEFKKQSQGYNIVIDAFAEVPDLRIKLSDAADSIAMFTGVINGDGKLTQEEANEFKQAWTTVFESLNGITADSFTTVFDSLNLSLTSENEEIRKQAKDLRISWLMYKNNMTQSMAEFQNEMDELVDKVSTGKATKEELAQYQTYVEELAKLTDKSFTTLDETIENGSHVDFTSGEEVTDFFAKVKEEATNALQEIDEGINSAISGLDEQRALVEFRHRIGKMGDAEYNALVFMFNQTEQNILEEAENRRTKVNESVQNAYSLILNSALKGLNDIPLDKNGNHDYISAIAYIYDYIEPIVKAIVDAGGKVDEELARALQLGVDPGEEVNKVVQGLLEDNQLNLTIADYIRKFYGDAEPEPGPSTDPLDQFIQKISDFERQYGEALNGLDNTTAEYAKRVKQNLDIIGQNTYGDDYTPDIPINTESPIEVPVQITINPIFDSDELYQQIRDKILNSDMSDTSVPLGQTFDLWQNDDQDTLQELRNRIDKFGIDQAFDMLTNYLNGDGWTLGKVGAPNVTASIPTVPVATTGPFLNGTETVKTEPADPTQDAANVETGVRKGNSDLVGLMRDLIDVTRASNNRPINVTVSPSSGWGFHNVASGVAVAAVTGVEV